MSEASDHNIGVVLQARMGSTRLPGKTLMPLGGTSLLEWIVMRLRNLDWPLVVATSDHAQDDMIARLCNDMGVRIFRGSERDVLDRYYQCAMAHGFRNVVRLTGDNPCPDIEELKNLVSLHLKTQSDYTHSFGELPIGMGAEVFKFRTLEQSWREANAAHHREHVNEYVLEQPTRFRIKKLEVMRSKHAPHLRMTIDTQEDYQRVAGWLSGGMDVDIDTEALIGRCSSSV